MSRLSILNKVSDATPDIDAASFTAICLASCKRLPAMRRTADARRLDRLVAAGAWTDAALALIAVELPDWQLRRLAFDDGEWHCALSTERRLPDFLDDATETRHPDMAIAILQAFQLAAAQSGPTHLVAIRDRAAACGDAELMCCDNYA